MIASAPHLDRPVPGLDWTVGQVAVHLFSVYGVFAAAIRGDDVTSLFTDIGTHPTLPAQIAATNASVLSQLAFESPEQAGAQLADAAAGVLDVLSRADFEHVIGTPWYGPTVNRKVGTLAALVGSETLVHGLDIARGLGLRHRIDARTAALVAPVVMSEMLPLMMSEEAAGARVSYRMRLRGVVTFQVDIADGVATFGPPAGRSDCTLSITPAAALLVGFGREPLWKAIATGQALSYGRRPWLGPRFHSYFRKP